jgi:hypothetical protein
MTAPQVDAWRQLLQAYDVDNLSPSDQISIELLACTLVEARELQAFANQHGTTYEVIGKSGDVYTKHRPEHQQLQDARQRAAQLARGITASQLDPLAASIDDLLA